MKFDSGFEPESEEEFELIKRVAETRAIADEVGMDDAEIAGLFQQASLLVLSEGDDVGKMVTTEGVCPECGTPIKDIEGTEIGQDEAVLVPCGDSVLWSELPETVLDELYFDDKRR